MMGSASKMDEIEEDDHDGKPSKCVLECQCLLRRLLSFEEPVYQCRLSHPLAACVIIILTLVRKICVGWKNFNSVSSYR